MPRQWSTRSCLNEAEVSNVVRNAHHSMISSPTPFNVASIATMPLGDDSAAKGGRDRDWIHAGACLNVQ